MTTACDIANRWDRVLPAALVSPDRFEAFAAHVRNANQTYALARGSFAVLVAAVRPFALATLVRLLGDDDSVIAVLDEAQFRGRCVALTPRPDWGYSLSLAVARDPCSPLIQA